MEVRCYYYLVRVLDEVYCELGYRSLLPDTVKVGSKSALFEKQSVRDVKSLLLQDLLNTEYWLDAAYLLTTSITFDLRNFLLGITTYSHSHCSACTHGLITEPLRTSPRNETKITLQSELHGRSA